jgi:hypothetical protein
MNISTRPLRLSRIRLRPSLGADARLFGRTRKGENPSDAIHLIFSSNDAASVSGYTIRVHGG